MLSCLLDSDSCCLLRKQSIVWARFSSSTFFFSLSPLTFWSLSLVESRSKQQLAGPPAYSLCWLLLLSVGLLDSAAR